MKKELFLYSLFSLFFIFSFLNNEYYLPWTTFDSEVYIFYSIVFASIVFFLRPFKKVKISNLSILLFLLLFISLFHYNYYEFKQNYFSFNLYLILILILSVISVSEDDKLIIFLIFSILISSALTSIIALIQFLDPQYISIFIRENNSSRYSGNLGQPNHMGTLMLMGFYSCLYIYDKYKFNIILILIPLLIFGMVLTQSRTVWVAIFISLVFLVLKWKYIKKEIKISILSLPIVYISINQLLKIFTASGVNASQRVQIDAARINLWQDFLITIPEFNIFGIGFKNIEYYHFIHGEKFSYHISSYHNIIMDMYAIFGVLGLIFCFYFLIKIANILLKLEETSDFIIYMVLVVIINHAMFEFPLYYGYFVLPLIVIFNDLNQKYAIHSFDRIKLSKNILSICFLFFLGLSIKYIKLYEENRISYRSASLGYCVKNSSKTIIFDDFENLGFINCKENINMKNLELFEKGFLNTPHRVNIKKLVYVYHTLGLFIKRDQLLIHLNKRYRLSLTVNDIAAMKY
ncbi:O-antigen ligase C-terminal domain-containing protein [Acinetobacter johnsonii]|uniref:O-antigen ligase family protein n=1 Tax=Acinetobacter johnsonii TaxID=40214 RepID=UPI0018A0521F|nr:O-antigen ligase family protein [Acinetobacter johnsonii]QPF34775.1 O-antigen ligase C-terminal domain-containing protein [Acinetobacter johnsonii]